MPVILSKAPSTRMSLIFSQHSFTARCIGIIMTMEGRDRICETVKLETSGEFDSQRFTGSVSRDVLDVDNSERDGCKFSLLYMF
jgi:hypothetical protein